MLLLLNRLKPVPNEIIDYDMYVKCSALERGRESLEGGGNCISGGVVRLGAWPVQNCVSASISLYASILPAGRKGTQTPSLQENRDTSAWLPGFSLGFVAVCLLKFIKADFQP